MNIQSSLIDPEVKNLGTGVAAGAIAQPASAYIINLFRSNGFIPDLTREIHIKGTIENLQKNSNMTKFDVQALVDAPCYLEEYSKQFNSHEVSWITATPLRLKIMQLAYVGVLGPLWEEFLFRELIQSTLLPMGSKHVIKKMLPNCNDQVYYRVDVLARVIITSCLFSAVHLLNRGTISEGYVIGQLVGSFVLGIVFGLLRESSAGLSGAIGAHIANNVIALGPTLISC